MVIPLVVGLFETMPVWGPPTAAALAEVAQTVALAAAATEILRQAPTSFQDDTFLPTPAPATPTQPTTPQPPSGPPRPPAGLLVLGVTALAAAKMSDSNPDPVCTPDTPTAPTGDGAQAYIAPQQPETQKTWQLAQQICEERYSGGSYSDPDWQECWAEAQGQQALGQALPFAPLAPETAKNMVRRQQVGAMIATYNQSLHSSLMPGDQIREKTQEMMWFLYTLPETDFAAVARLYNAIDTIKYKNALLNLAIGRTAMPYTPEQRAFALGVLVNNPKAFYNLESFVYELTTCDTMGGFLELVTFDALDSLKGVQIESIGFKEFSPDRSQLLKEVDFVLTVSAPGKAKKQVHLYCQLNPNLFLNGNDEKGLNRDLNYAKTHSAMPVFVFLNPAIEGNQNFLARQSRIERNGGKLLNIQDLTNMTSEQFYNFLFPE